MAELVAGAALGRAKWAILDILPYGLAAFVAYHHTRRCFEGLDNLGPEVVYSKGDRAITRGSDAPWTVTRFAFLNF